jgi:hypothetical protein
MTARITKLNRQVDQTLIEMLEGVLEDARAGNITDLVIVGNDIASGNFYRAAKFADRWRLLGAIEYAKDGINKS